MVRKLLVNAITLSRIVLSIIFTYCILNNFNQISLMTVVFAVICTTDLLDGRLARRLQVCSRAGALMDVFADLFFLITSSSTLIYKNIFPEWMLAVMIGKFIEFWCTSSIARKNRSCHGNLFLFDFIGRRVVVLFYLLPYTSVLLRTILPGYWSYFTLNALCFPIAFGAAVSSYLRIKACIRNRSNVYGSAT